MCKTCSAGAERSQGLDTSGYLINIRSTLNLSNTFSSAVIIISFGAALPWINPKLRNSLYLPLCQVCPARALFVYLQVFLGILPPTTNVPLLSIISLPIFLIGALVVRRGWCIICPNLGLLSFFHRLNAISLFRTKVRCTKCGTCVRVCAMGAADLVTQGDVSKPECIRCYDCIDHCPGERFEPVTSSTRKSCSQSSP